MKIEKELTLKVIIDYNQLGGQEVEKVYIMEDDIEIEEISRFLTPKILDKLLNEEEID